jgi:hypothetical protein
VNDSSQTRSALVTAKQLNITGGHMKKELKLLLMDFNGEYVTENKTFSEIKDVWSFNEDLGSKWFFFPFPFVITGQTIKDSPDDLHFLTGKRVKTVQRIFKALAESSQAERANVLRFVNLLNLLHDEGKI